MSKKNKGIVPELSEVPSTGMIRSTGVGLREGEIALLNQIAADAGLARNSVMRFGLRYFMKQYLAGNVNLSEAVKVETRRRLEMP